MRELKQISADEMEVDANTASIPSSNSWKMQTVRQTNADRSLAAKKRVIKMLFVVILEFFICWTPVYVIMTWNVLDSATAKQSVSPMTMNLLHLLSYCSACCNPITYCFMNKKFRQGSKTLQSYRRFFNIDKLNHEFYLNLS